MEKAQVGSRKAALVQQVAGGFVGRGGAWWEPPVVFGLSVPAVPAQLHPVTALGWSKWLQIRSAVRNGLNSSLT